MNGNLLSAQDPESSRQVGSQTLAYPCSVIGSCWGSAGSDFGHHGASVMQSESRIPCMASYKCLPRMFLVPAALWHLQSVSQSLLNPCGDFASSNAYLPLHLSMANAALLIYTIKGTIVLDSLFYDACQIPVARPQPVTTLLYHSCCHTCCHHTHAGKTFVSNVGRRHAKQAKDRAPTHRAAPCWQQCIAARCTQRGVRPPQIHLDQELLNSQLERLDLALELAALIRCHRR